MRQPMLLESLKPSTLKACCPKQPPERSLLKAISHSENLLQAKGNLGSTGGGGVTVSSASRGFGLSRSRPLPGIWAVTVSGVLGCQGLVRLSAFWAVTVSGFGLSRSRPLLGVLGCHGVVRFSGFWAVTVSSASRGFGLSRARPLLGVLGCHGLVRF